MKNDQTYYMSFVVHTVRFLKYVWSFFIFMHERIKMAQVNFVEESLFTPLRANLTKWSNTLKQFVGRVFECV